MPDLPRRQRKRTISVTTNTSESETEDETKTLLSGSQQTCAQRENCSPEERRRCQSLLQLYATQVSSCQCFLNKGACQCQANNVYERTIGVEAARSSMLQLIFFRGKGVGFENMDNNIDSGRVLRKTCKRGRCDCRTPAERCKTFFIRARSELWLCTQIIGSVLRSFEREIFATWFCRRCRMMTRWKTRAHSTITRKRATKFCCFCCSRLASRFVRYTCIHRLFQQAKTVVKRGVTNCFCIRFRQFFP